MKFFTTIATGSCGKFFRATRFFFRKKAKNYVLIEYFCTFCIISYNVSVNLSTYCEVCLLLQSKVCKTSLVGAFMHLCIYAFMHFCRELANDANYAFAQMRISFDKFHFCGNLKNKSRHHFAKKTSKISANCHCEWIIWCLKNAISIYFLCMRPCVFGPCTNTNHFRLLLFHKSHFFS